MKTVKIQVKWGGSSPWTRPSAPECGDTLKALAGDPASDLGWGSSSKTAPGSLSTGSPAGRTPPHRRRLDVQSGQREVWKVCCSPLSRALPSVIVDTEKVLREADGSVELVVVRPHADGKVIALGAPRNRAEAGEEPEDHKRHAKVYDRTVQYRSLGKTSDERLSRIYFIVLYFVTARSFTADGGLL